MSQLVRVIRNRNLLRRTDHDTWLPEVEIKSDAFKAFGSDNGRVSMYRLESGGPDLGRILAALALNRDEIEPVHYVLIERQVLSTIGAEFDVTQPGRTPDQIVNSVHENVGIYTATRLMDLVSAVWRSGSVGLLETAVVLEAVKSGFASNYFDRHRIKNEKMKRSLKELLNLTI